MATYAEQLTSVQDAIIAIESGGQNYSIATATGNRSVTRANLSELYKRELHLRRMVNRETRGGIRVTGITPVNNS